MKKNAELSRFFCCHIALISTGRAEYVHEIIQETPSALSVMANIAGVTGPRSTVGSESNCRSRGLKFDPGQVHTFLQIDHFCLI